MFEIAPVTISVH